MQSFFQILFYYMLICYKFRHPIYNFLERVLNQQPLGNVHDPSVLGCWCPNEKFTHHHNVAVLRDFGEKILHTQIPQSVVFNHSRD